jgi:hypothetical protein
LAAPVQRATDAHNAIPEFGIRQEAAEAVTVIQRRIADLTRLKSEGGAYGLSDDAASVLAERKKLERAISERDRQQSLYEVRSARWNTCMQLRGAASDWVLRGVPQNCVIEATEDQPISELLRKGEHIADGVERYRHRRRELGAEAHRVNSATWPSSPKTEEAKARIEQWAEAGAPNFDDMIEHNAPLAFPTMTLSSLVRGETPSLAHTNPTVDAFAVMCWLLKDQMLKTICAGLDEAAYGDKEALSQAQRDEMLATISADMLAVERSECALIWHAEAKNNEIIDFRADTSPQSLLGVALRTVPRAEVRGTTGGHAFDVVYPGGRR